MPGIMHEGPIELLRCNPLLAAALLGGLGVHVAAGGTAVMAAGDVSSALPAELRADAVILLEGPGGKLAVVVEVQSAPDKDKSWAWPAYLVLARGQHHCRAVLLVICRDLATARWARRPIVTGHPGFDLVPLVIDAQTTPTPSTLAWAVDAELAVLGALTGAIDLEKEESRRLVLATIAAAGLSDDRLGTYTHLIRAAAPASALEALEALMSTVFKDEFIERYIAEGRAKGEAEGRAKGEAEGRAKGEAAMLLRMLAALGFDVPDGIRDRVLGCNDLDQLGAWADAAATARSLDDVFPSD
jgi:hypothetical protein